MNRTRTGIRHLARGFTLAELLVVMAILAMIAAFAGPQIFKALGGAERDSVKVQIANFSSAIDQYRLDVGKYPTSLNDLIEAPSDARRWDGPYLKKTIPLDPWDNAYQYQHPGEHGDYDLLSLGADGIPGGDGDNADIVSWE
ncbi:MAG: type II secretion system protein GspG [Gammaproteobacteria bacterium]|nr:type II secretion system protein GspG [Gammaproteobacteria bacterium]